MNLIRIYATSLISILLIGVVFSLGYGTGKKIGDLALQDYISRGKQLALENSLKFRELEKTHSAREQDLLEQLDDEREKYEATISNITNDYNDRLLKQKSRADSYQRQLTSGECIKPEFISYATRLDKSLEEGIYLVEELTQTIRFLEFQLDNRTQIINNDRKTVNEKR